MASPIAVPSTALKPSQLTLALEAMIRISQPCFIQGPPGVAKSAVMFQTTQRMGYAFRDDRAVLKDAVDLRGLPHVNGDNQAHWCIPADLPNESRDGKRGVWFLDELNRAPLLVQNAYFQLILDRRLGDYVLPDGWVIMAAGNEKGAGVQRMDEALRSRFVFIDATTDLEDWCKWAVQPASDIDPMVIAFLRFRSPLLHDWDGGKERNFPCPRTWSFVSNIVKSGVSADIMFPLIVGAVGMAAAVQFQAFQQFYRQAPNIDGILLNPSTADIPTRPEILYAVSAALAHRASPKNFGRVIQYLDRIPEQEYAIYSVRDATARDTSLQSTREFTNWAVAHADVVF